MTALLPCPHCGATELDGPHFTEYFGDRRIPHWWVNCPDCPCEMAADGETQDLLIAAWNRRANQE